MEQICNIYLITSNGLSNFGFLNYKDLENKKLSKYVQYFHSTFDGSNQHLYITNDDNYDIGNFVTDGKEIAMYEGGHYESSGIEFFKKAKRIIFTTDVYMLKMDYNIQKIDEGFLNHFISQWSLYVRIDKVKIIDNKIIIKKYPVAGFAPGFYQCNCVTCNDKFQGDKRAIQCESCADKEAELSEIQQQFDVNEVKQEFDINQIEDIAREHVPKNTVEAFANFSDSDVFIAGFIAAMNYVNLQKTN